MSSKIVLLPVMVSVVPGATVKISVASRLTSTSSLSKAGRPKKSARHIKPRDARLVVRELQLMLETVRAEIAEFEAEEERRRKIDILLNAELAAPRKDAFYYRMARFMIAGICPEIVGQWLRTPNHLQ